MTAAGIVVGILSILVALIIHEFAHAYMSYQLGDPTAKYEGRLTLNPIVHFDLVGAICLVASYLTTGGAAIMGWAKAVPVNADNFKNRRFDLALVALAGPFINFMLACFCALFILTGVVVGTPVFPIFRTLVIANVGFGLFNLIPWPPLDGWKMLSALLGEQIASKMDDLEQKMGMWSLVGLLIIVGLFGNLFLVPANRAVLGLFLGGY